MGEKKHNVYNTVMLIITVVLVTFIVTCVGLYQLMKNTNILDQYVLLAVSEESEDIAASIELYKELIEKYYLGDIDYDELKEGAIEGYIAALDDPYTEYISAEEMEDYLQDLSGNFVGIGIYMIEDPDTNLIMVLSPISGGPAEEAGIQPGDYIISVDGVECTADDMTEISTNIKGEEGTTVKLEVLRGEETLEFEIVRKTIIINPVESEVLEDNIGYISFSSFDENTAGEFKSAYEELEKQGITSLIIDLRNNGGGIVDTALEIADYFVDKDSVLLYEVDKDENETVKTAENDPITDIPVVVLTNENTASASEILAGALQDLGRATIVGTTTYGKGVIQQVLTLADGSGLKITIAEYLTPNKTHINGVGIEPDEVVELPDTVTSVLNVDEEDDTQLQKAIELLKN